VAFLKDNCWKPASTRTSQPPMKLLGADDVAYAWVGTFLQKAVLLVEDRMVLVCSAGAASVARFPLAALNLLKNFKYMLWSLPHPRIIKAG